jgi:hypothetical protein
MYLWARSTASFIDVRKSSLVTGFCSGGLGLDSGLEVDGGVVGFGVEGVDGEDAAVVLILGRGVLGDGCTVAGGEGVDEGGESTGVAMLEVNRSMEAGSNAHHPIPFSTACSGA